MQTFENSNDANIKEPAITKGAPDQFPGKGSKAGTAGGRMELKVDTTDSRWWFWAATLAFIVAAILGWVPGYYIVMGISAAQVLFFLGQERSLTAFPTQIRLVYFAATLLGFFPAVRFYIYLLLLLGTVMVTFFGRCSISLMLKHMPWNQEREVRLN